MFQDLSSLSGVSSFMPSTNSGLPPAWHKRYLNVADTAIDEGIRAVDRGVTHSVRLSVAQW